MAAASKRGPGFHHIALRARDFEATVRFYTEGMGFQRRYGWGEGDRRAALMDTGDGNYIEVFAGGQRSPGDDGPEGTLLHYALRVADTDAALARAVAAGARTTMEPKDVTLQGEPPATVRIAFCKGLDGEVIEFFQNDTL